MRKRHSPEQIAASLRQAEAGVPVAEIIRKLGSHENTFYTWKRRFGGLGTPEIRELRQLREENAKLKQLVADLSLDRKMLQDIVSKKCKAGTTARACRLPHDYLRYWDPQCVRSRQAQPIDVLPKVDGGAVQCVSSRAHQRDRHYAGSLRVSPYQCPAAAGRLRDQR